MTNTVEKGLTEDKAAALLGISETELRRLTRLGVLRASRKRYSVLSLVQDYCAFLRDMRLTGEDMAKLLGVTKQSVSEAHQAGDLVRDENKLYSVWESVPLYVKRARGERLESSHVAHRKRLDEARANEIALRTAAKAGELVPLEEAQALVSEVIGAMVSRLVGLPARITRDRDERAKLESAIDGIRQEVADLLTEYGTAYRAGGHADTADSEGSA